LQVFVNSIRELGPAACYVGVLDAQQEAPAGAAREEQIEQSGARVA